jgi:hypothetical protein
VPDYPRHQEPRLNAPSCLPLIGYVDGQEFHARLLHRLRIELHKRQDFHWHPNLDREPELARLPSGERVVVRPVSTRKFFCKLLGRSLVKTRRQQLNRSALDLRQRLLAHVGEYVRQIEDVLDGPYLPGFNDTCRRKSRDLRIDWAQHRKFAEYDFIGCERYQKFHPTWRRRAR